MIKPWTPSVRLSPVIQLALNSIVGQKRSLFFRFFKHECQFLWQPTGINYTPKIVCNGSWNGTPFRIFLEELPPLEYLEVSLKDVSWEFLDEELRSILFEVLLQAILKQLKPSLKGDLSIESLKVLTIDPEPIENEFNLPFQITTPDYSLKGYGSFPITVLPEFVKTLEEIPTDTEENSILNDIPVPFFLEIGASKSDYKTLKTLKTNDIFLIDNDSWFKAGHLLLTYQRFCFAATIENNYIQLGDFMEKEDDNLPVGTIPEEGDPVDLTTVAVDEANVSTEDIPQEEIETVSREPQRLSVNRLPVNITFDLGSKIFALNEVNRLAPGFTFELDRSLESPVDIRANGTKIASGELVTINDRLGVRILSFYANNE